MYTAEALVIAKSLAKNEADRAELRKLLDGFDTAVSYSNQRFDQTQELASALTSLGEV